MNEFPIEAPPAEEDEVLAEQDSELEEQDVDSQDSDAAETQDEGEGEDEASDDEIEARIVNAVLSKLQPTLEEQARRTRQSLRSVGDSIMARVNERLATAQIGLDKAVKAGRMDAETARELRADMKEEFEQEEFAAAKREEASQAAQTQIEQAQGSAVDPETRQRVQDWFAYIYGQSGLTETDPEVALLPSQIKGDPQAAIDEYKKYVLAAVARKQERLGKTQPTQPKKKAPNVDMGNGSQAGRPNPLAGINDPDLLWAQVRKQGKVR